jgi:hypothetical protein
MDLDEPNIPEDSKIEIDSMIQNPNKGYEPAIFTSLYNEDQLGASITNLQSWLYTNFNEIAKYK